MKRCNVCLTILTLLNLLFQQTIMGQAVLNHVIPLQEVQSHFVTQSEQRTENIREVQKLLRHDLVQNELGRLAELAKVEVALTTLDDETLNMLANQSKEANDEIEAGLSTVGWIATIAAIPIIIFLVWWAANDN